MKILLISPKTPDTFWAFKHALRFIHRKASSPPLGLLTVAAMLPRTWELRLVDLDVSPLRDRDILWADYVFLGGMIVHRESAREVAARCRRLDRPVVAGGPLVSTGHEEFPDIEHFVLGEAERVMDRLVEDMTAGRVAAYYQDDSMLPLDRTPVPRWDLIRFRDYASMSIQFSRGCPFNCEFCDIVVMNGRVPRTKAPAAILAELDALRAQGWNGTVFLVDDNFIGNKRKVKELLREIIAWRRRHRIGMHFLTEASVNLADDPELLALMVEAGFRQVFLGIETPSLESLKGCSKHQNTRRDLLDAVATIQAAGLEVMGGFIVGFDEDTPDIFERQFEFIQKAGIVTAMVGLLTALPRTRLHRRLAEEGRLLDASSGNNTQAVCNFLPRLDRDLLIGGYRRLMRSLYEPQAFYERARRLLERCRFRGRAPRVGWRDLGAFAASMWELGIRRRGRRAYWFFLGHALVRHPRALSTAVTLAIYGHHFRTVAEKL